MCEVEEKDSRKKCIVLIYIWCGKREGGRVRESAGECDSARERHNIHIHSTCSCALFTYFSRRLVQKTIPNRPSTAERELCSFSSSSVFFWQRSITKFASWTRFGWHLSANCTFLVSGLADMVNERTWKSSQPSFQYQSVCVSRAVHDRNRFAKQVFSKVNVRCIDRKALFESDTKRNLLVSVRMAFSLLVLSNRLSHYWHSLAFQYRRNSHIFITKLFLFCLPVLT